MDHINARSSSNLPPLLPLALLGAPQGSLVLDFPSPNGSPDGEESEGWAGAPHASSVLTGAEADSQKHIKTQKQDIRQNAHIRPVFEFNGIL